MRKTIFLLGTALSVMLFPSCDEETPSPVFSENLLIGTWQPVSGSDCSSETPYDYDACTQQSRYIFAADGKATLREWNTDGETCVSNTGTGTWTLEGDVFTVINTTDNETLIHTVVQLSNDTLQLAYINGDPDDACYQQQQTTIFVRVSETESPLVGTWKPVSGTDCTSETPYDFDACTQQTRYTFTADGKATLVDWYTDGETCVSNTGSGSWTLEGDVFTVINTTDNETYVHTVVQLANDTLQLAYINGDPDDACYQQQQTTIFVRVSETESPLVGIWKPVSGTDCTSETPYDFDACT
ncbi:MAG: lipocalin family protein, partial [Salinivirgaceae bacterium]